MKWVSGSTFLPLHKKCRCYPFTSRASPATTSLSLPLSLVLVTMPSPPRAAIFVSLPSKNSPFGAFALSQLPIRVCIGLGISSSSFCVGYIFNILNLTVLLEKLQAAMGMWELARRSMTLLWLEEDTQVVKLLLRLLGWGPKLYFLPWILIE